MRAKSATRVTVSTFGTLAAIAGIEHGIGEILQGNTPPDGIVILSWPDTGPFRLLGGEPAMTIIPNFLVTGIVAICFSLLFLLWSTWWVHRKHSGWVLLLLSIAMLLTGGGFGPPVLGIIVITAATRLRAPASGWPTRLPAGLRRCIGRVWPWSFAICLSAWLYLFPGLVLLDHVLGIGSSLAVVISILVAFGTLPVTIVAAWMYDSLPQVDAAARGKAHGIPGRAASSNRL